MCIVVAECALFAVCRFAGPTQERTGVDLSCSACGGLAKYLSSAYLSVACCLSLFCLSVHYISLSLASLRSTVQDTDLVLGKHYQKIIAPPFTCEDIELLSKAVQACATVRVQRSGCSCV